MRLKMHKEIMLNRPRISQWIVTWSTTHSMGLGMFTPLPSPKRNVTSLHYPLCNAVTVKVMLVRKGMKDILVDNGSSINILFGAASDKLLVDHELTP